MGLRAVQADHIAESDEISLPAANYLRNIPLTAAKPKSMLQLTV